MECSEREYILQQEYILQSGTFILLSSQDLHYLFSHMKFISEKNRLEIGFPRQQTVSLS